MAISIRRDMHFCKMGDVFVFLDLQRNRYFMMHGEAAKRFALFLAGQADDTICDWLVDRGILEGRKEAIEFAPPHVEPPRSSYAEGASPRLLPVLIAEAIAGQIRARRSLRQQPLLKALRRVDGRERARVKGDSEIYRQTAEAFKQAMRYFSATDQCLPRGIAMMDMLARRGCDAQLVIGVTLPFAAHCWVQIGPIVLTDPIDRVRPYEPIFALG